MSRTRWMRGWRHCSAYLKRLEALKTQSRIVLAGPRPAIDSEDPGEAEFTRGLSVAEFESQEAWAETDRYVIAGVYARATVKLFKKLSPENLIWTRRGRHETEHRGHA